MREIRGGVFQCRFHNLLISKNNTFWAPQISRITFQVVMTSDVKGWEPLFYVCLILSFLSIGRAGASKTRRLITLISVGWLPPYLHPSGACLILGTRVPCGLLTLPRVTPNRGCASSDRAWKPRKLGRQHAGIFRLSVARQPAWQWPT